MALVFMDGFDAGDVALKWVATSPSTSTSTRFGTGSCLSLSNTTNPTGSAYRVLPSSYSTLYIGFAYRQSNTDAGTFLSLLDSGGTARLNLNSALPELSVSAGSVSATTSGANLQINLWDYIELNVVFGASGSIELRKNGITVASASGNTGAVTVNRIRLTGVAFWPTVQFDDLYVNDSSGAAPNNTFLGDVRVYTMTPNAAGTSTQFTPSAGANYTDVDELPYSATDYVRSATPGNRDSYAMSDLPANVTTIYGLQNNLIAKKTDAGSIAVKPVVRSGGTNYYGATTPLSTNDATISDLRQVDPATSSAWTSTGVNNMESGAEVA